MGTFGENFQQGFAYGLGMRLTRSILPYSCTPCLPMISPMPMLFTPITFGGGCCHHGHYSPQARIIHYC
ncbi:hypothetical protein IKB17_03795 [bacterium]|nr:hypothetical protein [bacterium]